MTVQTKPRTQADESDAVLRRRLVVLGAILALAAAAHLADHAIRGEIVADHNLNPVWDHSGRPFTEQLTPFTPSLIIPFVSLAGVVLTARRRLGPRFWLVWGIAVAAVVVFVHFVPGPRTETLGVIYRTYDRGAGGPVAGALAVAIVGVIVVDLIVLISVAIRARRSSREW